MENEKPMGIYIHIPFCNKKCDYCDFVSYSMDRKAQQIYLDALFCEIDMKKHDFEDKTFDSLYIGGGTPSIVYEGFIVALARKIYSSFHLKEGFEFTIEVNPSSFTPEKFFEYVEAGVNRISIGVQCLDNQVLANCGRIQNIDNIVQAFDILKESQFTNVSGDVMIGLPYQSEDAVTDTVQFLINHNVKHISVYSLQLEKHTALYDRVRQGKIQPLSEEKTTHLYNVVNLMLKNAGFKRYEVSNFARPGFESKHNKKYWDGTEYLGLGVSAHSFIDGYRFFNTRRLDTYIENMHNGQNAIYQKEYLTKEKQRTERIMLSLRTEKGLNLEQFKKDFEEDILKTRAEQIKNMIDNNMITVDGGHLKITDKYFYVSNSIITELI